MTTQTTDPFAPLPAGEPDWLVEKRRKAAEDTRLAREFLRSPQARRMTPQEAAEHIRSVLPMAAVNEHDWRQFEIRQTVQPYDGGLTTTCPNCDHSFELGLRGEVQ